MRKLILTFLPIFTVLLILSACQTSENSTPTGDVEAAPTETPLPPTNTPEPSPTPSPSPTPNAEMVIENSTQAMAELTSLRQEQLSLINTALISNTQTVGCNYEQPTNAYCQINTQLVPPGGTRPIENKYEILFIDEAAWTRQDGRAEWESVSQSEAEELSLIAEPNTPLQIPPEALQEVTMNGVTGLDGQAMYEIEANVDETAVSDILGPSMQGLLAFTQNMEISTTIWIGVEDFLIYQQNIIATFTFQDEPVEFSSDIQNSAFNEELIFPDPSATN